MCGAHFIVQKVGQIVSFVIYLTKQTFDSKSPSQKMIIMTPGQTQKIYATAWKITKDIIYDLWFKMVMKVNAHFAEHQ